MAVQLTFVESAQGATRPLEYGIIGACETCEGLGAKPGTHMTRCETCGGQGQVRQVSRGPFGQFLRTAVCPDCQGGRAPRRAVRRLPGLRPAADHPAAHRRHPRRDRQRPAHPDPGRGAAGERGAPAGDLYVQVQVTEDERFRREGLDVVTRVAVPVTDAMTGANVTVPTVEGEAHVESAPARSRTTSTSCAARASPLNGRGRGDQRVVVEVRVPKVQTEEGRKAVEKLSEQLDERSYREDEGFFDRLKSAFR